MATEQSTSLRAQRSNPGATSAPAAPGLLRQAARNDVVRGALLSLLLTGCTVGPNFEKPSPFAPAAYRVNKARAEASQPTADPLDTEWWKSFNDPVLVSLVTRAAAAAPDIRIATARLAQSRAQRGITGSDQYPAINGNSSYTRTRISKNGASSLFSGGGASGGSPGAASNGLASPRGGAAPTMSSIPPFDIFQGGFDASWELDLWGRVRRAVESADASLDASREARRAQLISTVAEVARNYIALRGTQSQLRIARDNLASARDSAFLTDARSRGGLATDLDVANARAQVASTEATLPQLEQQEQQGINAIGLLLGMPPQALSAELSPPAPVPPVPPAVPLGLPSELAQRRPDIRQAEAQLHAATADIGLARADFYPKITLSGSASLQSTQLKNLFNIASTAYSFGPSLTIPIFDGRRIRSTVELREAQQQEAAINYEKTILQAFTDVDNALIAYGAEQRRRVALQTQVREGRRALGLAQSRYRQGVSDFLEVLTAQRTVLAAEQTLSDSTTTVSTNLVALYKALGGGWEQAYPAE